MKKYLTFDFISEIILIICIKIIITMFIVLIIRCYQNTCNEGIKNCNKKQIIEQCGSQINSSDLFHCFKE